MQHVYDEKPTVYEDRLEQLENDVVLLRKQISDVKDSEEDSERDYYEEEPEMKSFGLCKKYGKEMFLHPEYQCCFCEEPVVRYFRLPRNSRK